MSFSKIQKQILMYRKKRLRKSSQLPQTFFFITVYALSGT